MEDKDHLSCIFNTLAADGIDRDIDTDVDTERQKKNWSRVSKCMCLLGIQFQ